MNFANHHYVDKQQRQYQALEPLSAYLVDGKLNPRQAMLIQHAIKHVGSVYTIEGHKTSQSVSYQTAKTDLLSLAKLELLHQSKQGRSFVFIASNDLEQRIRVYR
ncbi:MAG: hypothetical protein PSN36_02105 [Gammaproteobacteria bacterium]|nr:hypothetical protein [Gammaproteobacteria bacterium]